jgi:signal transduction histidine kinase/FixJ family two-component response regulator
LREARLGEEEIEDKKAKILIVDDESVVLSFASDALAAVGHTVSSTSNQREALKWIESESFDFLLTDIKMPEMDGIALAQNAMELDPDLGVLFMTGYADVDTAKKAIATGAYDYIMKPFELQEIREAVRLAMKKRQELQEKGGSKGLSQLSDLMSALYTVGDSQSLLKLILGFALFHFNLNEGFVLLYDLKAKLLKAVATDNVRQSAFSETELPIPDHLPQSVFDTDEIMVAESIEKHPIHSTLPSLVKSERLGPVIKDRHGFLTSFSWPANQNIKLILTLCSERELNIKDSDRKLLSVMLSLSTISLENLILFEEARKAMAELDSLQDHMITLERVATQGLMSAEIAHELNNFLTIIFSNVELFEMKAGENLPEGSLKHLNNVKNHLKNMEKFTASLSDAGKMESRRSDCDINQLITELVTFSSHQKRLRKIKVETELDNTLPIQRVDVSQMQQLLYNVLNNSADAIGVTRADGHIEISTNANHEESRFTLRIVDNGCGFSPDDAKRAFHDRFTTKETGHGFGLMVCQRIVDSHGGEISLESAQGQGSTIDVTIPFS